MTIGNSLLNFVVTREYTEDVRTRAARIFFQNTTISRERFRDWTEENINVVGDRTHRTS